MNFVVADLGTPQGTNFAVQHGLQDGLAIFINAEGAGVNRTTIPSDKSELRELLQSLLATGE